ncbi:MAG: hypothetical protein R2754_12280 [Microthrixaceae bacterium]
MILTISSPDDVHAQAVAEHLNNMGADHRIVDLSKYPSAGSLTVEIDGPGEQRTRLRDGDRCIDLGAVGAIWWRRPQPYGLHDSMVDPVSRNFALHEVHEAFTGAWLSLDAAWVNHPTSDEDAGRKVRQLVLAQRIGLRIPRTVVTSDPGVASAFIESCGVGSTIYKPFQGSEEAWRETRLVRADELDQLDSVAHAPLIFQEYVEAAADLRITAVDGDLFAARIETPSSGYQVDFRMEMGGVSISPYELPARIESLLATLMRELNIVYGAIDMRLTLDGDLVFLEVNPAGQWLFVEDETGQPIAKRLACCLLERDGG